MTESTELIHLTYDGNFCLECESTIIKMAGADADDPNNVAVQLDRTSMHPQGGGQPTDIGIISSTTEGGAKLKVEKVTIDRETGVVTHAGTLISGHSSSDEEPVAAATFEVGSRVQVSVDADTRRLLSECHTAGHVVDSAMARCGQNLPPTKGYHGWSICRVSRENSS